MKNSKQIIHSLLLANSELAWELCRNNDLDIRKEIVVAKISQLKQASDLIEVIEAKINQSSIREDAQGNEELLMKLSDEILVLENTPMPEFKQVQFTRQYTGGAHAGCIVLIDIPYDATENEIAGYATQSQEENEITGETWTIDAHDTWELNNPNPIELIVGQM